jgi:hypothetical protein
VTSSEMGDILRMENSTSRMVGSRSQMVTIGEAGLKTVPMEGWECEAIVLVVG